MHTGSALTFSQMLFIASQALPSFFVRESGGKSYGLAPRKVPLQRWLLQVLVLTSSSLLNNWVFKVIISIIDHHRFLTRTYPVPDTLNRPDRLQIRRYVDTLNLLPYLFVGAD
jgi:hypothetical protein